MEFTQFFYKGQKNQKYFPHIKVLLVFQKSNFFLWTKKWLLW
jgi:hypothetical protein